MSKSITVNSIYNFVLKVFRLIVPILVGPYIQRLFDVELYGCFNDASTWVDLALVFGGFGIYTYAVREVSAVRDDREKVRNLYASLFSMGLCTNIAVLIFYAAFVFFRVDGAGRAIYLALGFKVLANVFMVEWLNEAGENYRFITIKTILVRFSYLVGIFVFIKKPDDVLKYTLLVVLTDFVNNLVSFIYVTRRIGLSFKGVQWKKHLIPLISILNISNVNLLYTSLDKMILGQVADKVQVTIYKTPQDITYMIGQLLASIVLVAVPRLAYYSGNGRMDEFMKLVDKSYHSFMLIVFPACTGVACLAPEIMWIYGGGKYDASIPVLILFAIRTTESAVYTICANQILYVLHQEKFLVKILLACGLLNAGLDILLVLAGLYTPLTAIASTFIAEVVLMAVLFWHIRVRLSIPFHFLSRENLRYVLLSLTFVPITLLIRLIGLGYIWTAILSVVICMAVYFGVLLLLKDPMLRFLMDKVLGKLKRGKGNA